MKWYAFPLLSTLLLIASFYPYRLWPFGFIALVPLIYVIEKNPSAHMRVFLSGFTVGSLFPLALMYATVMEFTWLPEAHFFQTIIRWTSLPIALIIGLLYGSAVLFYVKKLRTVSIKKNIFILALVWALTEWLITLCTGGYNLGILAHTIVTIPFFVNFAAIGGIHFSSFIIILCNMFLAFSLLIKQESHPLPFRRYVTLLTSTAGIIIALFFINTWYLRHNQTEQTISIAVLQNSDRKEGAFGTFTHDTFSFEKLASLIREAKHSNPAPAIIIYPFSVAKEILSSSTSSFSYVATAPLDEFSEWVKQTLDDTTFVTWNTLERNATFYNEVDYWQHGDIVASYQKTNLFPFMDYTPVWAQRFGLYSTVIDETPGGTGQRVFNFNTAHVGSAVCSEVNSTKTIRANTKQANILLSIGSDAMFSDSFAAEFDLASAQFRSAENNVAIVRANRFGPSGFISSDGQIIKETAYSADGAFVVEVPYEESPRRTLYSIIGDTLFVSAGIIFVGILSFI